MNKQGTQWADPTSEVVVLIDETKSLIRRYTHLAAVNSAYGNKGLAMQYQHMAADLLITIPPEHRGSSR